MPAKLEKTRTPGVFKRGQRYAVIYRDADGRQRQESARTYDDARRLRASRHTQVQEGVFTPQTREKLADYALEWVERYQGRGRRGFREATRDEYRRDLKRQALPFFGGRRLEQVAPRDVARFVAHLCDEEAQGRYLADATVRRVLSPLRACLATAVAEGLIRHNPCAGVALPARDERRAIAAGQDTDDLEQTKALTTDELAGFLAVCPPRWAVFFRVLAATGLRWSEAVALRWSDVMLDGSSPHVHVRRAYNERHGYQPPKSRHSRRRVPVDAELVSALRAHRAHGEWPGDEHLVFPNLSGKPHSYHNTYSRVLKPTAQEAGVPWAGFHTFRHTCATRLFAGGRNAVQVSRWLGHHSAAFTLSVYVHLLDDDLGTALPSTLQPLAGVSERVSATHGNGREAPDTTALDSALLREGAAPHGTRTAPS
jgi:integrase